MSKKTSIIIVLLIVVIAVGGLWYLNKSKMYKTGGGEQQQNANQTPKVVTPPLPFTKTETAVEKLPDGFLKGFPLEDGAKVIGNYSAETASGLQSSRRFISAKTIDQNYKLYNDYLAKNKWKIITTVDTKTFKSISAQSPEGVKLDLSISENSATTNVEVDIAFLQPIKK